MSPTDHDPGAVRTPSEHAWFVRTLIGVVCLFVAALLGLNAPDRIDDSDVPVDDQPHTVEVAAYTSTVLFAPDVTPLPRCRVADPDNGAVLPTAPPSGAGNRYGGTPEGYATLLVFTASSETVVVTCAGDVTEPVVVAAENPGTPYLVARYGGAALLLVIAIGLLASAARLVARQRAA